MILFEDYVKICKGKDYGKMLALLCDLRPDLKHQTGQLAKNKNLAKLLALLNAERGNKLIVRKALNIQVVSYDLPVFLQPKQAEGEAMDFQALQEANIYWENLPLSLQEKLTEANALVEEKRRLSNLLHTLNPNTEEFGETVAKIIAYSENIDKVFAEKKVYDKYGTLPADDVPKIEKPLNDLASLRTKLDSVNRMIRVWAAKLNNSNECLEAGQAKVEKWRKRKAELERQREELKHKIANSI